MKNIKSWIQEHQCIETKLKEKKILSGHIIVNLQREKQVLKEAGKNDNLTPPTLPPSTRGAGASSSALLSLAASHQPLTVKSPAVHMEQPSAHSF